MQTLNAGRILRCVLRFAGAEGKAAVAQIDQFDGCTLLLSTGESDAQSHPREPVRSQAAAESEDADRSIIDHRRQLCQQVSVGARKNGLAQFPVGFVN